MSALVLTTRVLSSHNRDTMVHKAVKFHFLTLYKSLSTWSTDQLFATRPTLGQPPADLLSKLCSRLYMGTDLFCLFLSFIEMELWDLCYFCLLLVKIVIMRIIHVLLCRFFNCIVFHWVNKHDICIYICIDIYFGNITEHVFWCTFLCISGKCVSSD